MSNLTEEFTDFVVATKYDDLPASVVHETKRLLLDSVGCALAGITTDPGKMAVALAKRLGGPPESSIIGVNGKISCTGAAFANGQLINTVDYDSVMAGGHAPPYIIAGVLAVAESISASGRELILSTALGFEISARVLNALQHLSPGVQQGSRRQDRQGYANCNFGVAAGAGRLLNLDREKMTNALGIAGHLCQVLTWQRFNHSSTLYGTRPMTKYGMPGWQNTGGIMAALLAEMGYMGDTEVFDDKEGFWKFAGYDRWDPVSARVGLGQTWSFDNTPYKPYPCCGALHTALECFSDILEKNNLKPEDIQSVRVFRGNPSSPPGAPGPIKGTILTNIVDFQFGLPYILAAVAYKLTIGPEWQDMDTLRDPKILNFAEKVTVLTNPEYDKRPSLNAVEVAANGTTYKEEKTQPKYGRGGEMQFNDVQMVDKFRHNASRILTQNKIEAATESLMNLENVKSIQELMQQVTQ